MTLRDAGGRPRVRVCLRIRSRARGPAAGVSQAGFSDTPQEPKVPACYRASRPVLVASAAGEVTLKLEEGGFLLPLPTWWSAEELGALRLIRSDLRPMPVSRWYQASPCPDLLYPVATITVEAGLLIGPLPPGTYAFDVLLGTTPIGKITGTVRARRIEVMRLPR